jgi:hypothetical protein
MAHGALRTADTWSRETSAKTFYNSISDALVLKSEKRSTFIIFDHFWKNNIIINGKEG